MPLARAGSDDLDRDRYHCGIRYEGISGGTSRVVDTERRAGPLAAAVGRADSWVCHLHSVVPGLLGCAVRQVVARGRAGPRVMKSSSAVRMLGVGTRPRARAA